MRSLSSSRLPDSAFPPLAIRARLRWDVVAPILLQIPHATVLEVGCGQGGFGARLTMTSTYLGVELDPGSAAVAASRIEPLGGSVRNVSYADLPEECYDVVCFFEVLEHIEHDVEALQELSRFVKPGGYLLLSVPAFQDRFGPMDVHAGHYRRYEPEQIPALFQSVGLDCVQVVVYGWPLGYALEAVRNRIDGRALRREALAARTKAELTAASGRLFQPSRKATGSLIRVATKPFRLLQGARSDVGTGIVAVAQRPLD